MNRLIGYIKRNSRYENLYMLLGVTMQFVIYLMTDDGWLSLVSGVCGVVAVILCAQRKLSQYVWSFVQLITYMHLAYQQRFYGELGENVFYLVTMIWGFFHWKANYDSDGGVVITRHMSNMKRAVLTALMLAGCGVLYAYLDMTDDTQPLLDSVSTVPAFFAQLLFIARYRENWICWLIIDVASIVLWINAENYIMASQFVFWTVNCIYGLYKWKN